MRKVVFLLSISISLLVFYACKVDSIDPDEVELGLEYYPVNNGRYWEYEVEKTTYSLNNKKVIDTFYIREVISATSFEFDATLKQIARYTKTNITDDWVLDSLWTTKRTNTQALRTEQNTTKVKMVFSIMNGKTWNGNAYNSSESEQYSFTNFAESFTVKEQEFDNTVKVLNGLNLPPNLIETDERYEVYAKGVGNVFRFHKVLGHQPPDFDTVGVKQITKLINYGQ